MKFGTWNARRLCREGSLKMAWYDFDLVAVQQITWDKGGSQPADRCMFFYGNRLETGNHVSS
jgi:hypothetical protein